MAHLPLHETLWSDLCIGRFTPVSELSCVFGRVQSVSVDETCGHLDLRLIIV